MKDRIAGWLSECNTQLDDIPKIRDVLYENVTNGYYKLLSDNNMNPDDYCPKVEFKTENNQTIISVTPIPIQKIGGIIIKRVRFTY